jgi:uncharacterized membrane protein
MKKHSDKKLIYAALIGNSAIAVMKFIVAVISGSAATLAAGLYTKILAPIRGEPCGQMRTNCSSSKR